MDRREFLTAMAAVPAIGVLQQNTRPIPDYRVVTGFKPSAQPGMPGMYPGRVVTVHSPKCIDEAIEKVDVPTIKEMIARGMTTLTGDKDPRDSWRRFFDANDFVGIKINCSGAPGAMSMPDIVAEIARNLTTVGVKPANIVIHERGGGQIRIRIGGLRQGALRVLASCVGLHGGLSPHSLCLFGHHHGAHRSVLKHYNRRGVGHNNFGTVGKG